MLQALNFTLDGDGGCGHYETKIITMILPKTDLTVMFSQFCYYVICINFILIDGTQTGFCLCFRHVVMDNKDFFAQISGIQKGLRTEFCLNRISNRQVDIQSQFKKTDKSYIQKIIHSLKKHSISNVLDYSFFFLYFWNEKLLVVAVVVICIIYFRDLTAAATTPYYYYYYYNNNNFYNNNNYYFYNYHIYYGY